jgi:hypothetical protein
MLTGEPYEEAFEACVVSGWNPRHGMDDETLGKALSRLSGGSVVTIRCTKGRKPLLAGSSFRPKAIVSVWERGARFGHYVVADGGTLRDPAGKGPISCEKTRIRHWRIASVIRLKGSRVGSSR